MAAAVSSSGAGQCGGNILLSVFPKTNFTIPTPEATPNVGTTSPGKPFGGFTDASQDGLLKYNRAWSTATRFLSLPPGTNETHAPVDQLVLQALATLLQSTGGLKDLVSWYTNDLETHFRIYVLPELKPWQQPIPPGQAHHTLDATMQILRSARSQYLTHLSDVVRTCNDPRQENRLLAFRARIERNLHSLILHSFPRQRLQSTLASVMYQHLASSLGDPNTERCMKEDSCSCHVDIDALPLGELYDIGFGGDLGERAFAHAVNRFLKGPAIERRCFEVDWSGHSSVMPKLCAWVQKMLIPAIERAVAALTGRLRFQLPENDAKQFVTMAVIDLGRLRALSLFDYVKTWPASTGAIMDIWEYLNAGAQAEKAYVCRNFSEQIQRRLLHPGASTPEILSIYVSVIHTFKALDARGVLLEKVAVPIRAYLRARDDTVSIIAASFLAEADDDGNVTSGETDMVCADITREVANSNLENNRERRMLNWDDMLWVPDPIDAGPDYNAQKSEDIVAYILGLFEQEEFIKEVTNVLAQHLLHVTDSEYVKETRLVELLKSRLDATKLQAAEVMLKDVRDSANLGKRINPLAPRGSKSAVVPPTPREIQSAIPSDGITLSGLYSVFENRINRTQFVAAVKLVATKRDELFYPKRSRLPPEPPSSANKRKQDGPDFKAQILSSFFWPSLRSNEFDMPASLEPLQTTFENRFEALGGQRKLHFRPALARVSLRLELEDRIVEERDLPGWRASVIDAFTAKQASADSEDQVSYDGEMGLTAAQIQEALHMDEELVVDALHFWTQKSVLYQREPGTYAVFERLDMDVGAIQERVQQQNADIGAVKSHGAMLQEGAETFSLFIANMLRNQGPKEVGGMMGITGLLRMVLPTFTYGDEEVMWLLGQMESRGEVRREGEVWVAVA